MASAKKIESTRNTNDEAHLGDAVTLNSTTNTKIVDSFAERIFFALSNPQNKKVWLKLEPASLNDSKKGILLPGNGYWEMPTDNIYTGEISGISDIGTATVYATEY